MIHASFNLQVNRCGRDFDSLSVADVQTLRRLQVVQLTVDMRSFDMSWQAYLDSSSALKHLRIVEIYTNHSTSIASELIAALNRLPQLRLLKLNLLRGEQLHMFTHSALESLAFRVESSTPLDAEKMIDAWSSMRSLSRLKIVRECSLDHRIIMSMGKLSALTQLILMRVSPRSSFGFIDSDERRSIQAQSDMIQELMQIKKSCVQLLSMVYIYQVDGVPPDLKVQADYVQHLLLHFDVSLIVFTNVRNCKMSFQAEESIENEIALENEGHLENSISRIIIKASVQQRRDA